MTGLTIDDVGTAIASWRAEARNVIDEIWDRPTQVEWLAGRISALNDMLGLLGGTAPESVRSRLLGSPEV